MAALEQQESRQPCDLSEATETAFGANVSPLPPARLASTRVARHARLRIHRTHGHHGVSAGDADGDGLDDLYVSQPSGLPNRLFLNRGGGRFEDATEAAGLAVLDGTSESLFADVDNDGDQDLVLVTGAGLLLFLNDGKGHFTRKPDAFHFKDGLRGSPTSVAMADYDRDGFLDIYVCTYSYVIGTSEDKAGTPTPYHDARNGPPDVLLRNDGRGSFVDVTAETGLAEDNDRFGFAAAWADYDEDGWPDLLVANDFGRKNLYHNEGMKDGKVTFKDVAAAAGMEDFGAGMSAAWLTTTPTAPRSTRQHVERDASVSRPSRASHDAPAEAKAPSARARQSRLPQPRRLLRGGPPRPAAWGAGLALDALDFDRDAAFPDLYVVNGMLPAARPEPGRLLLTRSWRARRSRVAGTPYDDAWRDQPAAGDKSRRATSAMCSCGTTAGAASRVAGSLGLD